MSDTQAPPPPPDVPPPSAPPPPAAPPPDVPPSTPSVGGGGESANRTVMLILSYLWPLALVPYLLEKDDQEVQWHAKNGLVMTAVEIVLLIALSVVMTVLTTVVSCFGCLFFWIPPVAGLGFLGLHVYCIHQALNGKRFEFQQLSELTKHL